MVHTPIYTLREACGEYTPPYIHPQGGIWWGIHPTYTLREAYGGYTPPRVYLREETMGYTPPRVYLREEKDASAQC